jgi:hypothetical protein
VVDAAAALIGPAASATSSDGSLGHWTVVVGRSMERLQRRQALWNASCAASELEVAMRVTAASSEQSWLSDGESSLLLRGGMKDETPELV